MTIGLIDQLRGALPCHEAIRGTLIDGERLLELLINNNVGIKSQHSVELLEVDMQLFEEFERLP